MGVGDQTTTPKLSNSTALELSASVIEVSPCDSVNTPTTGTNPDIESGHSDGPPKNATTTNGSTSRPLLTTVQVQTANTESKPLTLTPTSPVLIIPATLTEPSLAQVLTMPPRTPTAENHSTIGNTVNTRTVALPVKVQNTNWSAAVATEVDGENQTKTTERSELAA